MLTNTNTNTNPDTSKYVSVELSTVSVWVCFGPILVWNDVFVELGWLWYHVFCGMVEFQWNPQIDNFGIANRGHRGHSDTLGWVMWQKTQNRPKPNNPLTNTNTNTNTKAYQILSQIQILSQTQTQTQTQTQGQLIVKVWNCLLCLCEYVFVQY